MSAGAIGEASRPLPDVLRTRSYAEVPLPGPGCTQRCLCRDRGVRRGGSAGTGVYARGASAAARGTLRRVRAQWGGGGACKRVQPTVPGTIPPGTAQQCLRRDTYVTGGPGTAMRDAIEAGVHYSQGRLLIYPRGPGDR
jgi:hypothetical protein